MTSKPTRLSTVSHGVRPHSASASSVIGSERLRRHAIRVMKRQVSKPKSAAGRRSVVTVSGSTRSSALSV